MFLVLASQSPRRKEILEQAGYNIKICPSHVDENVEEEKPENKVLAIATKKGLDIYKKSDVEDVVLSADTIVVIDDQILEKPKDKIDARKMIKILQGKKHYVLTAVFIKSIFKEVSFVEKTEVIVDEMTEEEIEQYINTKEPYDKAGGYAIQGIFSKYISAINGDFYNVMGLPISKVRKALKEFNLD